MSLAAKGLLIARGNWNSRGEDPINRGVTPNSLTGNLESSEGETPGPKMAYMTIGGATLLRSYQ